MKLVAIALGLLQIVLAAILHALAFAGKIAQKEPPVVLHLSILALLFSGLTSIVAIAAAQ